MRIRLDRNAKLDPALERTILEIDFRAIVQRLNAAYGKRIAEIHQNEFGITTAADKRNILATYGIGPCISIVGYEPNKKIGFLTHYQANTEVNKAIDLLVTHISRITDGVESTFEVRIIGGQLGCSEKLIEAIKRKINSNLGNGVNFAIVGEDILGWTSDSRAITLDTTTGNYDPNYNPLIYPDMRPLGFTSFSPIPSLSYFPSNF